MLQKVIIGLVLASGVQLFAPWLLVRLSVIPLGASVAYLFGLAPKALVLLLVWLAAQRLMRVRWWLPIVMAPVIVVLIALYPIASNKIVDRRAAELAAGDQRRFTPPPALKTLAVIHMQETGCDGLCQRLLLNDQVKRLLYVTVSDPNFSPVIGTNAIAYRLDRRPSCPPANLDADGGDIRLPGEKDNEAAVKGSTPIERMRLAIAGGHCLIAERATLGDADVALFRRSILNTQPSTLAALFGVEGETVRGERLSMFQHNGSLFRESYRRTSIIADKTANVTSWYFNASALTGGPFVRRYAQSYFPGADWTVFLTEMLGLDLTFKAKT